MDDVVYFWSGWEPIFRILVVGSITYVGLVILLRLSGKRTLTRMTTFDFVIAIAIGSAFGRILTASIVSISEAITAFILLILLQTVFSFLEVHSKRFKKFTTTPPTLLYYNGEFLRKNMRKSRIREDALLSAIRKKSFGSLNEVKAVVFETDGSFSVIRKSESDEGITYDDLLEKEEK
ncbi:DUF421 domain-containing protein [Salinimicrobium marinum]|uniref:DUF421 domain-containing protein n=1 Tax=Salinimicrobium marinum TaxID=680283 RepID=A0A918S4B2_9FLAO|nr:YetF domain-containing protein [Salinimicrobium marinum]GHA23347.1 DUF421 domain-containing protein [Salinimicrobium marinum]